MKVILLQDVKTLGKKGDTIEVNDGYARNYIIPRKIGVEATNANINDLKLQKANQAKAAFKLNVANGSKVPLQVKKTSKKIVIKKIASFDKVTSVTSSNSKVVTAKLAGNAISIKGGKKPGSAKVTVKTKYGASVTFTVKVQKKKVAAKKIAGVSKKLTMNVGQTIVLDAATNPLTAPDKIKFKSSAKKIVSVTKKGVIKAKKKGKATITIKAGKAKLKVKITVK